MRSAAGLGSSARHTSTACSATRPAGLDFGLRRRRKPGFERWRNRIRHSLEPISTPRVREDNPDTPDVDETNTSLDLTVGGTVSGRPNNGDEWFFNVSRISSDSSNLLPVYNWTSSNYFASHPHAVMTFAGAPEDFLPGDFDKNGVVDGNDFLAWQANFGTTEGATQAQGDANGDGAVDGSDFLIWQTGFGGEAGAGAGAVPEPTTAVIALLAGLFLACRRR